MRPAARSNGMHARQRYRRSGNLYFPDFKDLKHEFVVSDELEMSVVWVEDAFVYQFHGKPSLSFRFAASSRRERNSARIHDRRTRIDSEFSSVHLYVTVMRVRVHETARMIELALCESGIRDAPAILTAADYRLLVEKPRV